MTHSFPGTRFEPFIIPLRLLEPGYGIHYICILFRKRRNARCPDSVERLSNKGRRGEGELSSLKLSVLRVACWEG